MANIGQKKKPCEEQKIFTPKWLQKMHLENVVITYKSRMLKFKIQQKLLNNKKMHNDTFKCSLFFNLRKVVFFNSEHSCFCQLPL